VVDGGSCDATVATAMDLGFTVLETAGPGGRGAQLNLGAAQAKADTLLFLHCDTRLPDNFHKALLSCLKDTDTILGAFSLGIDRGGWRLSLITAVANIRSRLLRMPYGDQALFIGRENFEKLGGFPEVPIMEDFMLVQKARQQGKVRTLPQKVQTSARRWQQLGPFRTTCINQLMLLGYFMGVTPEKLAAFYRKRK